MFDELNIPGNPFSDTGALGNIAKQKAMEMAAAAIARKTGKENGMMGKAGRGIRAAQQIAGLTSGPGGNPAFAQNAFAGSQQQARAAETMGITAQMSAEIIIAGKPMNHYSHFFIHEQNDGHHHFSVTYNHDPQHAESTPLADALHMTGELIIINIRPSDGMAGGAAHSFTGIVTKAYKSFDHDPFGAIVVEGYAPTCLLDDKRTKSIKSWYKGNIAAIVKELTGPLQAYRTNVIASPKNITSVEYLCQYKETPYQFLRRMAHDYGEYFFYDGASLYYGKPQQQGEAIKLFYGKDCENLRIGFELKAVNHSHLVYHSATDKKEVKEAPASIEGLDGFAKEAYAISRKTFTAPSVMPAPFRASRPDLLETAVKSHAASEASDMYQVSGSTVRQELKVGAVIELYTSKVVGGLQVGSESVGSFIITRIVHRMEAGDKYHNEFEAVPSGVPMLPVNGDIDYPLAEAQPAVVTDNKDPDGQGRVRVKFYWSVNDGGISDWIKVLTPDAGGSEKVSKNRGLVTIPEIGDLVMVDFRYGNPDEPFITGSMHPGTKASGGGDGNNIKSLTSKSGHTLHMNDGAGITLMDKSKLNHIVVDGTNTITITAAHNITLTNGKSTVSMIDGKISMTADESINIQAPKITIGNAGNEKLPTTQIIINSKEKINASALSQVIVDSKSKIDVSASSQVTISGGEVQINKK